MQWLDEQSQQIVRNGLLSQAITYARSQRAALCRYTEDGELSSDNNLSEHTLRCLAVGRKNWMLASNDRGGQTAAALIRLIASCKLLKADSYRYLRDLLEQLPRQTGATADLGNTVPENWLRQYPAARLTDHGKRK